MSTRETVAVFAVISAPGVALLAATSVLVAAIMVVAVVVLILSAVLS